MTTFYYSTYTNGDQQSHTVTIPTTGSQQMAAFVKQCTLYGDSGVDATGTSKDPLQPTSVSFNQDGPVKNDNSSLYWTIIVEYKP